MNKVFINEAAGSWFDIDSVIRFEATTSRGIEKKEALLVTVENNAILISSNTGDGKESYSILTFSQARSWFRANKVNKEEIPEYFRDFRSDLEIK